ncbi:polysaccharide deacetylase family protein [Actinoplanes sp. NPDC051470]|uniref:polysaccharide deacetylase family protein n=1 Tax=Actinoplanes sp. NPDC051470 TaxID=3157224 RepID=UPI003418E7FC
MAATHLPRHSLDGEPGGRHRRPETLADTMPRRPTTRAATETTSGPKRRRRGRHVRPGDPFSITVRSLTTRDADGERPVMGSHRAPGTLPLEAWVLAGRPKQQALLAGLVAVGLTLVMIPVARTASPSDPVTVAGRSTVAEQAARTPQTGGAAPDAGGAKPGRPEQHDQPAKAKPPGGAPGAKQPVTPPQSAPPSSEAPLVEVPPGDGPNRSLRTTGSRTVALTFDDGPDPVQTPLILSMLAEYDVKATFCLVGEQVEKHPEIVRQIVAAGHTLCNHTWDHDLKIGKKKPDQIRADLERTNAAIQAAAPGSEVPFFRAPGGNFSDRLVQVAYQERMRSLYWEVDPRDWEHGKGENDEAHVKRVVTEVQKSVKPGAIVLSHDFNQPDTIMAYAQLLPWLSANFELGVPPVGASLPPVAADS